MKNKAAMATPHREKETNMSTTMSTMMRDIKAAGKETLHSSPKSFRGLVIAHALPKGSLLTGMSFTFIGLLTLVALGSPLTGTVAESESTKAGPGQRDWPTFVPVDPTPAQKGVVDWKETSHFLTEPDIMRRDPSDVIRCGDTYYVWYTKILKGQPGYPGGWSGSVWYATSQDGHAWKEQGFAVQAGSEDDWDGAGVYTPNILPYQGKYYLAYTAMPAPFYRKLSRASIGIAVSDSPDGPWKKLENNPVIKPSDSTNDPDSFLCDDAVFVLHDDKIWLYYKGFAGKDLEDGTRVRFPKTTFLLTATAEKPEGPYTKVPKVLHRGHEALVWKDSDFIGSMCMGWGPVRMFSSADGIHFNSIYELKPLLAAGIYRGDLEEGSVGARPTWGIAMPKNKDQGLCRFEIIWPQDDAEQAPAGNRQDAAPEE